MKKEGEPEEVNAVEDAEKEGKSQEEMFFYPDMSKKRKRIKNIPLRETTTFGPKGMIVSKVPKVPKQIQQVEGRQKESIVQKNMMDKMNATARQNAEGTYTLKVILTKKDVQIWDWLGRYLTMKGYIEGNHGVRPKKWTGR